jgi:hypothetical protein
LEIFNIVRQVKKVVYIVHHKCITIQRLAVIYKMSYQLSAYCRYELRFAVFMSSIIEIAIDRERKCWYRLSGKMPLNTTGPVYSRN